MELAATTWRRHKTKKLAGSVPRTKSVRLQTEHKGTRRTIVTFHEVLMDITEEQWPGRGGVFFLQVQAD